MSAAYAIVWLDHHTAHVITFARTGGSSCDVIASGSPRQLHRKSGVIGAGLPPDLEHEVLQMMAHL